jgi:quercetin dioxygenase-like cupin family protein
MARMEHYTWDEMPKEVLSEHIARKIVTGEKAMVAQVFLAKGAVVPEHFHESEQITYILEGALKFELEGKEIVVGKGQVLRIPSNVPHRAVALEDTLDLDIFSPIRHDWLKKDDEYLRRGETDGPRP